MGLSRDPCGTYSVLVYGVPWLALSIVDDVYGVYGVRAPWLSLLLFSLVLFSLPVPGVSRGSGGEDGYSVVVSYGFVVEDGVVKLTGLPEDVGQVYLPRGPRVPLIVLALFCRVIWMLWLWRLRGLVVWRM